MLKHQIHLLFNMNPEIKSMIKTFESRSKGQERFSEFLQYCFRCLKVPKNKRNSKKIINKYDILRQDLIKYFVANEKEITKELSK